MRRRAGQGVPRVPQHIHGYLATAHQAINEHGGLAEGPALESALQAGHQARADAVREPDTDGFNGREALDKAIAHGVLAEDPLGAVSFGIPSFHGYVVELGE